MTNTIKFLVDIQKKSIQETTRMYLRQIMIKLNQLI